MSILFRCRCGRLVEARATARTAMCPYCRRTVKSVGRRFAWIVAALLVGLLGTVGVLAALRPKTRVASVPTAEPAPKPIPPQPKVEVPPVAEVPPKVEVPPAVEPPPPAPVAPKPANPDPPRVGILQPAVPELGRFQVGDTFDQEVTVTRRSAAGALGVIVGQGAEYTITSAFKITKVNADGSLLAEQTIRSTKLIAADDELKENLATGLTQAKGAKFELKVGPDGQITSFNGVADPIRVQVGRNANEQTFRLWSILDADAWKELSGLTFFLPDRPLQRGAKWSRDATHDWGALGSWRGKTAYTAAGPEPTKRGSERVEYAHNLSYRPPAAPRGLNLSLQVVRAEFQPVVAGGVIAFDPTSKRTTAAEEMFRVRGAAVMSAAGAEVNVEVDETQKFRVTVTVTRELQAHPPVGSNVK